MQGKIRYTHYISDYYKVNKNPKHKNKMKRITIKNGEEINDGTLTNGIFTYEGKSYQFPFTSSSFKREKRYLRGVKRYDSIGTIELDLCFGLSNTKEALKKLGIESNYQSRTYYEHCVIESRKNIDKLVRGNITLPQDKVRLYCFNELKRKIPNDLVDLIEETDLEFLVEPIVTLGDEIFNRTYAIYGYKLVMRSKDLFDAEVKIEEMVGKNDK